jgi:glycosyltransferase involved in cell wall biosynthesis
VDSGTQIIYIGEVASTHKKLWYKHARPTLFPIQWVQPFGLVLIESMACGTPVLAFNKGSVPEIVMHGKTGFFVDTFDGMIEAVKTISLIDPSDCRNHIKDNFSIASMTRKYSQLYQSIVDERTLYHA